MTELTKAARARFESRVQRTEGCWLWTGLCAPSGYGRFSFNKRWFGAHRVAYELWRGPIADGMVLDHLCHGADDDCLGGNSCPHRRCVNPAHLEPVTERENTLRGLSPTGVNAAKDHCDAGHPFSEENTYVYKRERRCRACLNAAKKNQQYPARKARSRATQRALRRLKSLHLDEWRLLYAEEIAKEAGQ